MSSSSFIASNAASIDESDATALMYACDAQRPNEDEPTGYSAT
jgi:hypothetical protein